MSVSNLIATLYPVGDDLALQTIRINLPLASPWTLTSPRILQNYQHNTESASPAKKCGLVFPQSECLQLKFDHPRKNRIGFLVGTSKTHCDIVLPNLAGLSSSASPQCLITFDELGRLILRDLGEQDGTSVRYGDHGGCKRRGFMWILSGERFTRRWIKVAFNDNVKFHILVDHHDINSPEYKEKVAQFRNAATADVEGLPQILGALRLQSTAAPTGAQTSKQSPVVLDDVKIGEGIQAVVTRVWDVSTSRNYACKSPKKDEYWSELRREAGFLKDLNHENIVRLICMTEEPERRVVLEYFPLGSLRDQHEDKLLPISSQEAFQILLQGLSALRYLHERDNPIAHCDIKPENILIESRSPLRIKLSDLGTSKWHKPYKPFLLAHPDYGTHWYMAPEVHRLQGKTYDESVDIWSLGVVIYEFTHGLPKRKRPVDGDIWVKVVIKQLKYDVGFYNCELLAFLAQAMVVMQPHKRYPAGQCLEDARQLNPAQCQLASLSRCGSEDEASEDEGFGYTARGQSEQSEDDNVFHELRASLEDTTMQNTETTAATKRPLRSSSSSSESSPKKETKRRKSEVEGAVRYIIDLPILTKASRSQK